MAPWNGTASSAAALTVGPGVDRAGTQPRCRGTAPIPFGAARVAVAWLWVVGSGRRASGTAAVAARRSARSELAVVGQPGAGSRPVVNRRTPVGLVRGETLTAQRVRAGCATASQGARVAARADTKSQNLPRGTFHQAVGLYWGSHVLRFVFYTRRGILVLACRLSSLYVEQSPSSTRDQRYPHPAGTVFHTPEETR